MISGQICYSTSINNQGSDCLFCSNNKITTAVASFNHSTRAKTSTFPVLPTYPHTLLNPANSKGMY